MPGHGGRLKQREEYFREHAGHEGMHAEMVMIFFSLLALTQVLLLMWRRVHLRSFNTATTIGLWAIPLVLSVYQLFWRFVVIWTAYTIANAYVLQKARQQPVQVGTPRYGSRDGLASG